MKDIYLKLIELEKRFAELASKQFSDSSGLTRENTRELLEKRGAEIRQIIYDTNNIIEQHIIPFIKDPLSIDREQAAEFQELASKLSGYKEHIDIGLSYELRNALTIYAKETCDEPMFILNMFYKGLALFYLEKEMFRQEMSECYRQVLAFANRYESFDKDTRNIIARAHGNYYISVANYDLDECFRRYDKAYNFWENVGKKVDPDFPWNAFSQNLNENICSTTISVLRTTKGLDVKEEYKKRLLKSSETLYELCMQNKLMQTNDYTTSETRHIYFYYAARYYNNQLSAGEFVYFLYNIYLQADEEYSNDDIYKKLHMSALFLHYLQYVSEDVLTENQQKKLGEEIEQDVFNFAMNMPHDVNRSYVAQMITNFAVGSRRTYEDFNYVKMLLTLTVFRHPPTFVHSVMVSKIAFCITKYLIKYHPEKLLNIPDIETVEDVRKKAKDILMFVWFSGLIHDIGKIGYTHLVSFYVRKLNDKEFDMIKQHSPKSKSFIKNTPNLNIDGEDKIEMDNVTNFGFEHSPRLFSCFSDIALGHHKSYDGKFGYPNDFDNLASPVKAIIDIITISDTIDAATDVVGRSYANEKRLEDLREDMLSQIGTRYCPFVTKLVFEQKELYDEIQDILQNFRYDTYYQSFDIKNLLKSMMPVMEDIF